MGYEPSGLIAEPWLLALCWLLSFCLYFCLVLVPQAKQEQEWLRKRLQRERWKAARRLRWASRRHLKPRKDE